MTNDATRIAWFRLAHNRSGGRASLLALALLIGGIGGLGAASIAGSRATENSYPTLIARSNPSAMSLSFAGPVSTSFVSKLPGVRHVEADDESFNAAPLRASGAPDLSGGIANGEVGALASLGGEYFTQDRVSVVAGRMANPHRADEFMSSALGAKLMRWHVGERIKFGFYTSAQDDSPQFGSATLRPKVERTETLVGTVVFTNAVVQDEVDQFPTFYVFTPAATRGLLAGPHYVQYNFQLNRSSSVAKVEREIIKAIPRGVPYTTENMSVVVGEVDRSIRPEALALGAFGVLALVAALLVGLEMINRRLRLRRGDQEVLRALGASRLSLLADSTLGPLMAIVGGGVLAVVVAVALSPWTLIGPVRPLLSKGLSFDGAVLLSVAAVLIIGLALALLLFASRLTPGRRSSLITSRGSRIARTAMNAGLSAPAVTGMHFAFESGQGRRAVPVRSVLVGLILAVTLICTTLTFASGLSTLIARPPLYGWNWNDALSSNSQVPSDSIAVLRANSKDVQWSGANFGDVQLDGVTEPMLLATADAAVSAPLLSGHEVRNRHQIVLGPATMAQLHKRLGQTVTLSYGVKHDYPAYVAPTTLTIVGTATLPAIGESGTLHPSMGNGAIGDVNVEPAAFKAVISANQVLAGPDAVFVRLRPGVSAASGNAILRRAAKAGDAQFAALPNEAGGGAAIRVLGVQYPAEIINYKTIGTTPLWLALAFALGVTVAFGLTIASSVRQRRRELALLKTLGFTRRQLSASIAWQASASVVTGLVVGIPLGILCGRELWTLFARQIYAVPLATIPTVALVLLGVGALVLANVVAIVPRRAASRIPAGVALRAE